MTRHSIFALAIALLGVRTASAQSAPVKTDPVAVGIEIRGELSGGMLHSVERGVTLAKEIGASVIVYEIDSPGGLVDLMSQIAKEMDRGEGIRSVALVTGSASSAAAYLAIGCDELYMMPGTNIGSAKPIHVSPIPLPVNLPMIGDPTIEEKFLSEFRARFRARAERAQRNQSLAEGMVDQSVELVLVESGGKRTVMRQRDYEEEVKRLGESRVRLLKEVSDQNELVNLTAEEALEYGFVDGLIPTRGDLLQKLGVSEASYREIRPNWLENLADFVSGHSWLFFIAACVLLFIEAKVPGFGLPGILGLVCFALLLFGNYLSGLAEMQEILLVLLGLGLIAVELFVIPGTLIPGVIGALAVLVGVFLSFQDFLIPKTAVDRQVLENNVLRLTLSLVASIAAILVITRYLPRTPWLRWLVLSSDRRPDDLRGSGTAIDDLERAARIAVGSEGRTESELRPAGKISLGERVLDAVTEGTFVERGQPIRVVKVEGNRIVVRPVRG